MRTRTALFLFLTPVILMLVLLTSGVVTEAHARGPYGSIRVGNWSGGAFTDDSTGAFSSCIARATYKSGITFGVSVSKNIDWALAFFHPNWTLSPGQRFPIVLSFDGRNTFNVPDWFWRGRPSWFACPIR